MTVDLFGREATDGQVFVLAHMLPWVAEQIAPDTDPGRHLAAKKWEAGGPLPFFWASCPSVPEDDWASFPVVRFNTIAAKFSTAMTLARQAHRRMLVLVDDPLFEVVLPSGRIADLEYCEVISGPHEVPYAAESVATRVVSEYRLALTISAA